VEIRFAIMIALTASEIADIDSKGHRHGGTGIENRNRVAWSPHRAIGVFT
jgi:hypothetical protein